MKTRFAITVLLAALMVGSAFAGEGDGTPW